MTAPSTRSYMHMFSRFGLTWHRKVHFSTISGKRTFQSTRNGTQNLPFCPGSLQDNFIMFLDISPTDFSKIFPKRTKSKIENRVFVLLPFCDFFLFVLFLFGPQLAGLSRPVFMRFGFGVSAACDCCALVLIPENACARNAGMSTSGTKSTSSIFSSSDSSELR